MFPGDIEVRLLVRANGLIEISGPDLVQARPFWDYLCAELGRETTRRISKLEDRKIVTATAEETAHVGRNDQH